MVEGSGSDNFHMNPLLLCDMMKLKKCIHLYHTYRSFSIHTRSSPYSIIIDRVCSVLLLILLRTLTLYATQTNKPSVVPALSLVCQRSRSSIVSCLRLIFFLLLVPSLHQSFQWNLPLPLLLFFFFLTLTTLLFWSPPAPILQPPTSPKQRPIITLLACLPTALSWDQPDSPVQL